MSNQTTKPLSPRAARQTLGLTRQELAAVIPCALTTIYVCEDRKDYPKRPIALRNAYLKAVRQDPESLARSVTP